MPRRVPLRAWDVPLNLLMYIYFLLGYVLFFLPPALAIATLRRGGARAARLQRLNGRFLRGFFWLLVRLGRLPPIQVPEEIRSLRGRVLVCNHQSYLDPLLFIASFERHTTVVKPTWFRVPVFGWFIRNVGYLAPQGSSGAGSLGDQVHAVGEHLASGGILFLFPEGHRSRDGQVGHFQPGVFKLARHLGVDVELLQLQGTAPLLPPGSPLLHTRRRSQIRLTRLGRITARELSDAPALRELVSQAEERYRQALPEGSGERRQEADEQGRPEG